LLISAPVSASEVVEHLREKAKKGDIGSSSVKEFAEKGTVRHARIRAEARALRGKALCDPCRGRVNGVGKTTTIGKLAAGSGTRVIPCYLLAGDHLQAAAIEQLDMMGKRANAQVVKHQSGSDPSAVVFRRDRGSAGSRGG